MQDVTSGTRSAKLSSGRKTTIPNAVRTVHKAEIIRLYISACEREGYTHETGRPSERTLWNILNHCPASQRKSLAGLDNVASEGSDAFDKLISLCKTTTMDTESDMVVKALTEGRRYLKGNYHHHCSTAECDGVANHCLPHALSNPKDPDFDAKCLVTHGKQCTNCDQLSNALEKAKILLQSSGLPNERKAEVEYDCNNSIKSIENWKAHILMTINQESAKQEILESLDHQTAFIVIDFAMKILARSYRESMAHWFGKAGMGMHVSCVVIKKAEGHNEESFKKRTYYNIYW